MPSETALHFGLVVWGLDEGWERGAPVRAYIFSASRDPVLSQQMMLSEIPSRTVEVFGYRSPVALIKPEDMRPWNGLGDPAVEALVERACESNPEFREEVRHGDLWRHRHRRARPLTPEETHELEVLAQRHSRRVAAREHRPATPAAEWGRAPCVALPRTDAPPAQAVPGELALSVDGNLTFHPDDPRQDAHRIDPRADAVWAAVVEDTSDWNLDRIDPRVGALVIHDTAFRYYLQPDQSDGYFEQWIGRLRDIGVPEHPPGWTS